MTDILPEKWMKGVAITTTCLAVMTAIAASRGTACVSKTQLLTAVEGSQWAYYQAKSIKQNLIETQLSIFEVEALAPRNSKHIASIQAKLNECASEAARYEKEKNEIRTDAEATGKLNRQVGVKSGKFLLSVVFFQIAIMLSSVSALIKTKELWYVGLASGVIAIVYLCYGLFLKPLFF
ncbi:MAG TPA: DUF4337 domain-containing protein [Candidatus Omnitrophota bacterium]|nr:DUF4337 domain-containing protein [Candidatus Omnitrophota bacterium]MDD5738023.1 DUF4337 domain-containing protein [Candidatus Omnitrophota bacterium]HOX09669.1 DUF4337 domain-containing protein [Candidatus Omnitrophota bacterium]HPN66003.1 DUF4337 domain-containing protein [Candidatus Omnitrophota bacterium]HRZ66922.1 DUF4337 domain-containing protein [Candidatus Omnitrophota bacterium]